MALIIGLTGSIGTGKSTIANKFRQLNFPIVDADIIAREVVQPGAPAFEEIVATFGEEIMQQDGTLDRKKLGAIVFNDRQKRLQLNDIIHPAIRAEIIRQKETHVASGVKAVVLDIPLLYESKLTHFVDKVIVVTTDKDVQLARIMKRDESTIEEAEQRIKSQIPVAEKEKWADAIIDNNGTIKQSEKQLEEILIDWGILD